MRTIALDTCPACGAQASVAIEPAPGMGLARCQSCDAIHAREYADPGEVFTAGYLTGGAGQFGIDVSHPRFQAFLSEIGDRRLAVPERLLGGPGSLLDVGCGSGELLAAATRRGWRATGVEPIADAAQAGRDRGLRIATGLLADADLGDERFDVVSAFHVLEHLTDVPAFVRELTARARPGGYVLVESPNWDAALRHRHGADWVHLRPLEHLTHFTPTTFAATLARAGLDVEVVRTYSYAYSGALLDELTAGVARPGWTRRLARISPTRTVLGAAVKMPSRPVKAGLRAVAKAQERRGAGSAVLALARVPG